MVSGTKIIFHFINIHNLCFDLLTCSDSQPVSWFNISRETNFVAPVTILSASFCIFCIAFTSYCVILSQTTSEYSRMGRIKEVYIICRYSLSSKNYNFLIIFNRCHALEVMQSICSCQVPSCERNKPKCL